MTPMTMIMPWYAAPVTGMNDSDGGIKLSPAKSGHAPTIIVSAPIKININLI